MLVNFLYLFQTLKMPYCSNKPVPTPGHLLPRPKLPGAAESKKQEENSLKRKIIDSFPDSGNTLSFLELVLIVRGKPGIKILNQP